MQVNRFTCACSALAFCVATAATANAQGTPAASADPVSDDSSSSGQLEEIVVTAERRTESLQSVPISATVLDSQELTRRGITDFRDLQTGAPGLSIAPAGNGESFVTIRGVGTFQTAPTTSPGVAVYEDGVYLPIARLSGDSLFDVGGVEVLRGPQGTLVGESSTGGAILLRSAKPTFDNLGGYFQQSVGNYRAFRTEAALNVPVSDVLAARASFFYETRKSFSRNLGAASGTSPSNANRPGNINRYGLRLQLAYAPTENLDIALRFSKYNSKDDGPAIKPVANALDPSSVTLQDDPFTIAYDTAQRAEVDGLRASAEINYITNAGFRIRSVSTYSDATLSNYGDSDYGRSAVNASFIAPNYSAEAYSQEINLISEGDGPFKWVVGGFFHHSDQPLTLIQLQAPAPGAAPIARLNIDLKVKKESRAVFGQASYSITPDFTLTAGGRYTENDAPFVASTVAFIPGLGFVTLPSNSNAESEKFTYRVAADWNVTPDVLIYGSYATGYKAGGANLSGFVPAPSYAPEENKVFEAGVKSTLFDRHLRLNVAAFRQDYRNLQVQGTLAGLPVTINASRARIDGAEAEMSALFGGLRIDGQLTYLDTSTREAFTVPTGPVAVGSKLPFTSEWSGSLAAQYTARLGAGDLTPRLQYTYASGQNVLLTPGPNTVTDKRSTLDFRLTYLTGNWMLEGYVNNLTDRTYVATIVPAGSVPVTGLLYGNPREFGARATYRF